MIAVRAWLTPTPSLMPAPVLAEDEVHAWRATLDDEVARADEWAETLSVAERARADRFRFERDRRHFVVRRGLLRAVLGRYLGVPPAAVQLGAGAHGKPELAAGGGRRDAEIRFSCAHSRGLAVYTVARRAQVGVDVEYVRPVEADGIARCNFTPREWKAIRSLPEREKLEQFFRTWTLKEAYLKATGDGLTRALDHVEVDFARGRPSRLLAIGGDPRAASAWSARVMCPERGYVAAVVYERAGPGRRAG